MTFPHYHSSKYSRSNKLCSSEWKSNMIQKKFFFFYKNALNCSLSSIYSACIFVWIPSKEKSGEKSWVQVAYLSSDSRKQSIAQGMWAKEEGKARCLKEKAFSVVGNHPPQLGKGCWRGSNYGDRRGRCLNSTRCSAVHIVGNCASRVNIKILSLFMLSWNYDPYLYPFPKSTFNPIIHIHIFSPVRKASCLHSANTCFEPNYLSALLSLMHCQGNLPQMSK